MAMNTRQFKLCAGRAARALAAAAGVLLASQPAAAQNDLTVIPFTAAVGVDPLIAGPDVRRTISVSGVWPNSCVPVGASAVEDPLRTGAPLIIQLQVPQTLVACLAALTPYSLKVDFTPKQGGARRLIAVTSDGKFLGQGELVTQYAGGARSLYDLTGAWFDPATGGSGLVLLHSFLGSDILAGGWAFYDNQGKSRWYSIQLGRWITPTEFRASLLEFVSAPGGCGSDVAACPLALASYHQAGTVSIRVLDRDHAVAEASTLVQGDIIVPLFRSNLTRLGF
jgi:hypothetical protein